MRTRELSVLNVAVGKHAFTLALDKASDTSDIDHVNALSDFDRGHHAGSGV